MNLDYVQKFSSELYSFLLLSLLLNLLKFFGEGSNANYLLKGFKHTIHPDGLPDGLLSKAATKILVGYDTFHAPGIVKYKDFRFYYVKNKNNFFTLLRLYFFINQLYFFIR